MPNRVLRDWTNSERFDELSEGAEVFFTRLIMKADDFGGFYGNTKLLKSHLFPLKDFKHTKISVWIEECVNIGIILYYSVDGKEYVRINDFGQRTRIMKSKFPDPLTDDSQMTDNCQASDGLKPKPKPKPNQNEVDSVGSSDEQPVPIKFSFRKSLSELGVEKDVIDDWLKVRKTKKATNSKIALNAIIREIEKSGKEANEIIKICVINSWSGFKNEWFKNTINNEKKPKSTSESRMDAIKNF